MEENSQYILEASFEIFSEPRANSISNQRSRSCKTQSLSSLHIQPSLNAVPSLNVLILDSRKADRGNTFMYQVIYTERFIESSQPPQRASPSHRRNWASAIEKSAQFPITSNRPGCDLQLNLALKPTLTHSLLFQTMHLQCVAVEVIAKTFAVSFQCRNLPLLDTHIKQTLLVWKQ